MSVVIPVATRPAGFWIRFVAFLIDGVVLMLAQFLLRVIAARRWGADLDGTPTFQGGVVFFTLVFAVFYPTALHAIAGQTVGKMVVGVRVVGVDGALLPLGAAFLRAVTFWFALLFTLGLGHVVGGLRKDKRALHDLLAGSRVEHLPRRRPAAPLIEREPPIAPEPAPPIAPSSPPVAVDSEPRPVP